MPAPSINRTVAIALALLLVSTPAFALSFPLSDEAIRDAYFLGQRRDTSMADYLAKYQKNLAPPDTGPHIASVQFLTPFASLVLLSSQRNNYSAQQATIEHRGRPETVTINIQILFTDSYPPIIAQSTGSHSSDPVSYALRPSDFWKDFAVQVSSDNKVLEPDEFSGEPNYVCGEYGGCTLTGATLTLEFPAKVFVSDTATIQVDPPEGPQVAVDFNLINLR